MMWHTISSNGVIFKFTAHEYVDLGINGSDAPHWLQQHSSGNESHAVHYLILRHC